MCDLSFGGANKNVDVPWNSKTTEFLKRPLIFAAEVFGQRSEMRSNIGERESINGHHDACLQRIFCVDYFIAQSPQLFAYLFEMVDRCLLGKK